MSQQHQNNPCILLLQVPNGLVTESGIHLNKGCIYIGKTSPPMVRQAYQDQFTKDFTTFLHNRCEELVPHGQLLLTIVGENDEESDGPHAMNILGNVLNDMVVEVRKYATHHAKHKTHINSRFRGNFTFRLL